MPRRDDFAHGLRGVVDRIEDRPHGPIVLRIGRQADPHLGDDRQRAFAAHQHAQQVKAGEMIDRAKLQDRAVAEHGFQAEHVVDGDAIFERMRAAGIGGHVAADGAGALARRVGGIVIARAGQRLGEPQVGHAGLDHCHAIARVDLEDPIHPRQHDHHGAAGGQTAAGQTGSRPAGDHRRAVALAQSWPPQRPQRWSEGKTTAWGRRRSIVKASQS